MAEASGITVEISKGVQTIRFARPEKKNAITVNMYRTMADALLSAENSDEVRVHLFAGTPGCFTAGNDLQDFLAVSDSDDFASAVFGFLEALARVTKPMVAAVDGEAIGVGTTMLFHMDLVYASEKARFRTPFIDLALPPEGGSSLLMPRRMGHQRAFEMLCLGETYHSGQAKDAGFINQVVPTEDLENTALKSAHRLAAKSPEALAIGRKLLRGDPNEIIAQMRKEGQLFMERLKSSEAKAAFQAFLTRT